MSIKSFGSQQYEIEQLSKMSILELMNIKITTAGKTSEKISDIPASVVIIRRDEIARNGYQTLQEILENTLGMYAVNDFNVLGTDFGVRGHKSARANENIIFLVNGINQTNDMYKNNPLNQIIVPVEAIDKIEIVRGPMSVIYGSGAFFGAINIITNEREKTTNMVSASIGSFNSKKAFIRLEENISNLYLSVNASLYDDSGMEIFYEDITSTDPNLHDKSINNNMAKNEKYFNISGKANAFYFDMSYSNSKNNPFVNFPLSKNAPAKITGTSASLGYKKDISRILSVDGKVNFTTYKEEVISDYYNSTSYQHYELFKTNTFEADLNTFIKPISDIDITLGLYYRYSPDVSIRVHAPSEGLPGVLAKITDGQANQAIYSQINYRPFEKLQLTGGLRVEDKKDYNVDVVFNAGPAPWLEASKTVKDDKIQIIPRLAAIYYLNNNHQFKLLYGEAIKYASFHLSITSLYMPNQPLLDPERIQTFEFNYLGRISSNISTNISFFNNRMNNLISRISGVDENGAYYQYDSNKGELITNGVEALLNVKPGDKLSFKISGLFQKTKDIKKTDIKPSFSPNFLGYIQTSYNYTDDIIFSLTSRYVSKMKSYWDVTFIDNDPNLGSRGFIGNKIDGYFIINSNLRLKNLFNYDMFFNLKFSNILDAKFQYPTTSEVNWANKGYPGPGRTFQISLGREF